MTAYSGIMTAHTFHLSQNINDNLCMRMVSVVLWIGGELVTNYA